MFANKKGMEIEAIGKVLIVVVTLVFVIILIILLSGKGSAALSYIKDLFRFG